MNNDRSPTQLISEEQRLQLMRILADQPQITQRDLAKGMGLSVGKAHYCLKALIEKGHVKADNFRSNPKKRGYLYLLTPKGIEEKGRLTLRFLDRKLHEFDRLQQEIQELKAEIVSPNIKAQNHG